MWDLQSHCQRKMHTQGLSPVLNKIHRGTGWMLLCLHELWLWESKGRRICTVTKGELYSPDIPDGWMEQLEVGRNKGEAIAVMLYCFW